jgi:hypothetical protein
MATARTVYHVVPNASNDAWIVTLEKNNSFGQEYPTKAQAIEAAKELALEQEPSQVKVHGQDGSMEYESTYGEEPAHIPD